jgi:hypothetical protein
MARTGPRSKGVLAAGQPCWWRVATVCGSGGHQLPPHHCHTVSGSKAGHTRTGNRHGCAHCGGFKGGKRSPVDAAAEPALPLPLLPLLPTAIAADTAAGMSAVCSSSNGSGSGRAGRTRRLVLGERVRPIAFLPLSLFALSRSPPAFVRPLAAHLQHGAVPHGGVLERRATATTRASSAASSGERPCKVEVGLGACHGDGRVRRDAACQRQRVCPQRRLVRQHRAARGAQAARVRAIIGTRDRGLCVWCVWR